MRDNGSDGNPTAPDSLRGFPPAPERDEDTGLTPTFNLSREPAGRRFFDEMDRDHDGKLKLDDLKVRAAFSFDVVRASNMPDIPLRSQVAMRRRKMPEWYAKAFYEKAKPTFFARSLSWEDFESAMNERESTMLRAYNSLGLSRSGRMTQEDVKKSLNRLGLPATDENATAMLKHLDLEGDGFVTYGQFRNFMMLLPKQVATSSDPSVLWFESSTMVQINQPKSERSATVKLAIQAALAGALASGVSTAAMHPLDTLKTRVQSTVGKGLGMKAFLKTIPEIGAKGLYRGIIPAVVGAASGHGFRTATYEVVCKLLVPLTALPLITEIQIQGFGSGFGTLVGTSVRIPCEVLKQRLQTGQHDNAVEAFKAITKNGTKGLFAGTAATLSREIPFYVIGLVTYEKLKQAAAAAKRKELTAWETIALGGMSGAIAAAATTPADVLKTRAMTGQLAAGEVMWVSVQNIVKKEGAAALFKGVVPRMMWIAPLGAMNFAGYELAKRAMQSAEAEGETKAESGTVTQPAASKPTPAVKPSPALTAVQAAGEDGATQIADAVVAEIPTTSGAEPAEEQTSSDTIAPVDAGLDASAPVVSTKFRSLSSASAEVEANTKPPGSTE